MESSVAINELATALSKAQGEITGALKDSANPFFKSKYADLASCWDACRTPLSKNGLALTQFPTTQEGATYLVTTLLHTSGQWMRSALIVQPKDDTPQGMGSALTYARRYALTAIVGVAQVDDDGNAASGRPTGGSGPLTFSGYPPGVGGTASGPIIDPEKAFAEAAAMRDIMLADLDHRVMALKVYDKHLLIAKDEDLYQAASKELTPKERSDWKAYVKEAKELEKEDRAVTNVGRRF